MRRVRFNRRTSIRGGNVFDEGEIVSYDEARIYLDDVLLDLMADEGTIELPEE